MSSGPFVMQERLQSDERWMSDRSRIYEVAPGQTSNIVDVGTGVPTMFVPMLEELNVVYSPQMRAVSEAGRRAITYAPLLQTKRRLSVSDRVSELAAMADFLRLTTFDLVAWSDTAAVAHRFALQYPERVRSLTFVVVPDVYRLPTTLRLLLWPLVNLPIERLVPIELVAFILGCYMSGPLLDARTVRSVARRIPNLGAVLKWSCLPCIEEHRVAGTSSLPPVLVIAGRLSRVVTVQQAQSLHRATGSKEAIVIIDNGEHVATYSNHAEVTKALLGFLKGLSGDTTAARGTK